MVFDAHDFYDGSHRLDLFALLKEANPLFKATVMIVPGLCTPQFLSSLPPWLELCAHGWMHPHPHEASTWSYDRAMVAITEPIVEQFCATGWCSPGGQVSDGTYQALADEGWWIADHPDNDARRPAGLQTHIVGTGDHIHTHVENSCGNGLEERFNEWSLLVEQATDFQFVSEAVTPWKP